MGQDIFVFVEHLQGTVADVTFELLGKARQLAAVTGGRVIAGLAGAEVRGFVPSLGAADAVLLVEHAALAEFNPGPYQAAVGAMMDASTPRLALIGNTSMGMDLAATLSVRRDLPLVAYATDIVIDGAGVLVTSQLYGGKICVESAMAGGAGIVSALAGAFPGAAGRREGAPAITEIAAPAGVQDSTIRFKSLEAPEKGDVDITQHDVLVCVGRGIQNADNIQLAQALAEKLGGAVCASRPVVDSKWLPKTRQVGKSGLKVKPRIYLALGLSGAPEHIEGMKDAELIIAVNTDRSAPIFDYAHYGTTEDLFEIVPALTAKL